MKFKEAINEIFKDVKFNEQWYKKNKKELDGGYTLILETYDNLEARHLIKDQKLCIKTDSLFETIITAMFCKAFKTYQCTMISLWNGYNIEAENLSRSLFELLVNMLFICQKQRKRRASRFLDYKFVEDIVLMKGFDAHLDKIFTKMKKRDKDKRWRDYEKSHMGKKRKFLIRNRRGRLRYYPRWSKEDFGEKCDQVGLLGYKKIVYYTYSSAEHSGPGSVLKLLVDINGIHRYFHFFPGYRKIDTVVSESSKFFVLIFLTFASVFNLSLSKQFDKSHSKLKSHEDFRECFTKNKILNKLTFI